MIQRPVDGRLQAERDVVVELLLAVLGAPPFESLVRHSVLLAQMCYVIVVLVKVLTVLRKVLRVLGQVLAVLSEFLSVLCEIVCLLSKVLRKILLVSKVMPLLVFVGLLVVVPELRWAILCGRLLLAVQALLVLRLLDLLLDVVQLVLIVVELVRVLLVHLGALLLGEVMTLLRVVPFVRIGRVVRLRWARSHRRPTVVIYSDRGLRRLQSNTLGGV